MDATQIKARAMSEMLYKAESLCRQDIMGIKSKYTWDELFLKFNAYKILDDVNAEEATKQCVMFWLNDTIDSKIVSNNTKEIQKIYVYLTEPHYRGEIYTAQQMTIINASYKEAGWWWSIAGRFTFDGVTYNPQQEVYWTGTQWSLFGYDMGQGSPVVAVDIETGALVANVEKSVAHNLNKTSFQLEVKDVENNVFVDTLKPDPSDPHNSIIIKVGIDMPDGLTVSVIGY